MNHHPGFRVENGSTIRFVVIRRVVIDLQQRFNWNDLTLVQQVQVSRIDRAGLDLLVSQSRVSKEFRKSFVQPDWQVAEVQTQQCVRIFMVEGVKRIISFRIDAQNDIVLVLPRLIHSGVMNVALHFPFFREK